MYLNRQHPIRVLLDQVTSGGPVPSTAQLDELLTDRPDLPEGVDLGRFRDDVIDATKECAAIGKTGQHAAARRVAEERLGEMVERMTDDEKAVDRTEPNPESTRDIAARMFTR